MYAIRSYYDLRLHLEPVGEQFGRQRLRPVVAELIPGAQLVLEHSPPALCQRLFDIGFAIDLVDQVV